MSGKLHNRKSNEPHLVRLSRAYPPQLENKKRSEKNQKNEDKVVCVTYNLRTSFEVKKSKSLGT